MRFVYGREEATVTDKHTLINTHMHMRISPLTHSSLCSHICELSGQNWPHLPWGLKLYLRLSLGLVCMESKKPLCTLALHPCLNPSTAPAVFWGSGKTCGVTWFPQLEAASCLLCITQGMYLAGPWPLQLQPPHPKSHHLPFCPIHWAWPPVCLNVALLDLPIQPTTEVLGFGLGSSSSSQHLPFRFYDQCRRGSSDPTVQRSVFASVDKVPGELAPPCAIACPPWVFQSFPSVEPIYVSFSLLRNAASWKHQVHFLEFIKV